MTGDRPPPATLTLADTAARGRGDPRRGRAGRRRQAARARAGAGRAARRRPRPARRPARRGQDAHGPLAGHGHRAGLQPHPVHPRPAAGRHHRRRRARPAAAGDFEFRPGPVFANLVLADEVNRAPAKTQSALLEAMQERQVSADGVSHPLPRPFLVVATQNPIEYEGTYPLPEAQLDRFLLRTTVGYPSPDDEWELVERRLERGTDDVDAAPPSSTAADVVAMQRIAGDGPRRRGGRPLRRGHRHRHPRRRRRSRSGASPRGSLALVKLARAHAAARRARLRDPRRREGASAMPALGPPPGAAQRAVGAAGGARGGAGPGARRRCRRRRGTDGSAPHCRSAPRLWAYARPRPSPGWSAALATGRAELAIAVAPVALRRAGRRGARRAPRRSTADARARRRPGDRGRRRRRRRCRDRALPATARRVEVRRAGHRAARRRASPTGGRLAWMSAAGGDERRLAARARPPAAGASCRVGPVWVRVHGPLGLVRWQGAARRAGRTVRVLPAAPTLRALLPHPDPRATSGAHLARRPGDGIEFAERPSLPARATGCAR